MALNIPLPRVVPDVEAGGPIVTAMRGQNALTSSALDNQIKQVQAQYAQPTAQATLQQLQLANVKNQLANQMASNIINQLQAKQRAANQLNNQPGRPTQPQPTTPNAIPNQTIPNNAITSVPAISGGGGIAQPVNALNQPQPSSPTPAISGQQTISPQNQQDTTGLSYADAAYLSKYLGLGEPKIVNVSGTGKTIAVSPFGNVDVAQGLSPTQEAYQKGKGAYAAKSYGDNVEAMRNYQARGLVLDQMVNLLDNPEFRNVTGPVGSNIARFLGTPEQQQLLGQLQSESGEIVLQVAPSLKGAFTGKDQTLIDSTKANTKTDFPDVFIGKLKAQKLMQSVLEDRARLAAQYTDAGMSPLDAQIKAAKDTPLDKYRPIIEKMINAKTNMVKMSGIDPKDKKIKTWLVPADKESIFLKNNFRRVE